MNRDEASELRIEIARVLEQWQRERLALDLEEPSDPLVALQHDVRHSQLSECIDALSAALLPRTPLYAVASWRCDS